MPPSIIWFRRDLRLGDHPALQAAAGDPALALFVLDEALIAPSGKPRLAFLYGCLRDLDDQLGGRLLVVRGNPADVVPRVARSVGASSVHVCADAGPYGRKRDQAVEKALSDVDLIRTGSPYAVTPGRIVKADGTPYRVFTPFSRAWAEHGWRKPADTSASTLDWIDPADKDGGPRRVRVPDTACAAELPEPGERAAIAAWEAFRDERLPDYGDARNRPDLDKTSRMSPYLRWGCVHPRTLLADLGPSDTAYRTELAWREFYADVLWHRPETARANYNPRFDRLRHDDDSARFDAWRRGETGYPIVDAGMRQLLAEGWMHNRVRMITASFLTKDLHLPWWWGARHFMTHLVDGDLASNQHGWQWTAGSGTDAAPYFRVFNPTSQGRRFDPDGAYIRRYIPELRDHDGDVHEPDGAPGYPAPIVDHAEERKIALDRYADI